MKDIKNKLIGFPNIITFFILIVCSIVLAIFDRSNIQLFLILTTFLCAGFFIKRIGLFTGIAIMTISVLLTLSGLVEFEQNKGGSFFKKFQFIIGSDKEGDN